ncbi:MAG: hypothetical protein ACI901_000982 [Octadecabacter sp.]
MESIKAETCALWPTQKLIKTNGTITVPLCHIVNLTDFYLCLITQKSKKNTPINDGCTSSNFSNSVLTDLSAISFASLTIIICVNTLIVVTALGPLFCTIFAIFSSKHQLSKLSTLDMLALHLRVAIFKS